MLRTENNSFHIARRVIMNSLFYPPDCDDIEADFRATQADVND
jgi:hypothetical protein